MALTQALSKMNLRTSVLAGSNAAQIACTGIATEDTILFVLHVTTTSSVATIADVTSHVTINAAGYVLPDADYSSDTLIVFWVDASGGTGYTLPYTNLKMSFCDGHASAQTLTGIKTADKIIAAFHVSTKANVATMVDYTSSVTVSAADTLAYASDTTNDLIIVIWSSVDLSTGTTFDKFGLKISLITGHGTASTLTGIATEDSILSVWHFSTAADIATIADSTALASISAANTVAWSSTTADDHMLVFWMDRSL